MEKIKAEKVGRMLALAHLWVSSDIPTQPRRGVEEKESGKQSSLHLSHPYSTQVYLPEPPHLK